MARILGFTVILLAAVACNKAASNRIVGGELTTIEYYTSLVQVEFLGVFTGTWSQSCAANILNSRNVLSAAHCFEGFLYEPSRRRIRAGATFRNTGGILALVEREFNHPTYGLNAMDGDVAVVRLSEPLVYSPVVQQATIVAQDTVLPDNLPVVHAGWGATSWQGPASSQLQDVTIYTVNNELCRQRYLALPNHVVTTNMICAGILDVGGRDACQGDSGGPLYYDNILVGIVSWGHQCANDTFPGVSTAVAPYTNWIVQIAES
ncbi:trypsin, alkaline C [Amyelois transitella]|uniref:trypsin, alkaline C n=1 Tax=Amyelois transitella TaxID=680683 RepID=UPI00067B9903|nr:trypsin, alkaline C [Amyelois transitella]